MVFKVALILSLCAVAWSANPWEPAPRNEQAGWTSRHEHLLNMTKTHLEEIKVACLGDSITEGWNGAGHQLWAQHYANRGAFNYGIGGDRVEHVLWRVENGEFDGVKAKLVVLKIGTNNLYSNKPAEIAKGIQAILDALHKKMPDAKVLLLSVLPRQPENADTMVHEINALISRFADNVRITYLDLAVHFELSLGHEVAELYNSDHVHLTTKGYEMWYKVMEPTFAKLIA